MRNHLPVVICTSLMAFNSWLYGIFAVVAGTCYWLIRQPAGAETDRARLWLVPLLGFGIVLGIVFPSQSGVFFGVAEAKPYWNNPLLRSSSGLARSPPVGRCCF